jgi:WD40 repeat protein
MSSAAVDDDDCTELDVECVAVLTGHTQDVKTVRFHPHADMLVSVSYDDSVKVWCDDEGDDWHCDATLRAHSSTVWGVCFDASGRRFVTCSDDSTVIVWQQGSSTSGEWRVACRLSGYHRTTVYSVDWSWSADNGRIVTGDGENSIKVFTVGSRGLGGRGGDASSGGGAGGGGAGGDVSLEQEVSVAKAHAGDVNCVRWHPRQPFLLASAGDDGLVKLWRFTPSAL